jgi:hypothetical protein
MSASDRILMQALAEAIGGTPPPVDLEARCEGLLAWIDVDSELATLLDQPTVEAAGTRGAAASTAELEFAVDDGTCVIELTRHDNALHGQVLGDEASTVVVRTAAGVTYPVPLDGSGRFVVDRPPSGPLRLDLELVAESRRIHTDWFVI